MDGALLAIEGIRPVANDRAVSSQRVARMVRIGDQVDGGHIRQDGDVGTALHGRHQAGHDGLPGAVAHMQDAAAGMGGFLTVFGLPIRLAVELDVGRFNQDFLQKSRPFFRQDARRPGRTGAGPGGEDIFNQQVSVVVQAAPNNAPLGVTWVPFVRVRGACDNDYPALGSAPGAGRWWRQQSHCQ